MAAKKSSTRSVSLKIGMHKKNKDLKIAQHSFDIDPAGHKKATKGQKIYNKGKGTDNPNEKETFLKRTGPRLPLAKKKSKKRYG